MSTPPPRITHVGLKNYKAFGDTDQSLRLRPLTLVFGRNNAGKSAIVRLPTLLAGSMRSDAPRGLCSTWDGITFGQRLEHFVHNQVANRCTLRLGMLLHGEKVELVAEIGPGPDGGQAVHRLVVTGDGWTWDQPPDPNVSSGGILPSSKEVLVFGHRKAEAMLGLRELAPTLVDRLGPIRAAPEFSWPSPTQPPKRVQSTGADAAAWLAWDRSLTDEASAWLERITGSRLSVSSLIGDTQVQGFSLLIDRGDTNPINIALAGTGIQQVLPVVVQLTAAMVGRSQAGLIVIEEPETHMHPAAHAELAELLLAASRSRLAPPILVETHSETLLLRLRRRIAEQALGVGDPNERIGVYFVDDFERPPVIRELRLDDEGFIEDWPQRVFDEDAAERRALHRALAERNAP